MDRPSEAEDLITVWRALANSRDGEGWRAIPVATDGRCRLLAGIHFPGNEEAILLGFRSVRIPSSEHLPEGNGFIVRKVDYGRESGGQTWIGLVRQESGSLEMFTLMATDIISTLKNATMADDERLFSIFLGRIRAWQNFMLHGKEGVLSPEAEIGLHGELVLLSSLLEFNIPPTAAIECWCGPIGGLQDFRFASGAIEVKTTISEGCFPAKVGSLEQLDENLVKPLFLAGVRLRLDEVGLNLPDRVSATKKLLQADPTSVITFDARLLHAGFSPLMSERYSRRFSHMGTRIITVSSDFPRLTRGNVPRELRKANYEIDLDLIMTSGILMSEALQTLGAI